MLRYLQADTPEPSPPVQIARRAPGADDGGLLRPPGNGEGSSLAPATRAVAAGGSRLRQAARVPPGGLLRSRARDRRPG
jgi:hypothetical protein